MKRNSNTEENNRSAGSDHHENPLPQEISNKEKQTVQRAHEEAVEDMSDDSDMQERRPNEDLDEGESARLGGDKNALI